MLQIITLFPSIYQCLLEILSIWVISYSFAKKLDWFFRRNGEMDRWMDGSKNAWNTFFNWGQSHNYNHFYVQRIISKRETRILLEILSWNMSNATDWHTLLEIEWTIINIKQSVVIEQTSTFRKWVIPYSEVQMICIVTKNQKGFGSSKYRNKQFQQK